VVKNFRLLVLCFLVGCGGTPNAAGAIQGTFAVIKDLRRVLCTTKLEPLLGDPREGQPVYESLEEIEADDAGEIPVTADASVRE
jgi:hypothetical protein